MFNSICSVNIFVWAVALLCHAAATNFAGLFACRAFLGICEGAITPGFLIVTSMFYTRQEQTQRVGYWCMYQLSYTQLYVLILLFNAVLMNGFAVILLGFISYGTLHIKNDVLSPWQWLFSKLYLLKHSLINECR